MSWRCTTISEPHVRTRKPQRRPLGFWGVVTIGIGGMVGGGIFAVLGLAVQLAKGGTPIAFAIAGLVTILTSYSYAKLSVRYPSQGGTVEFLNRAFGLGLFTGGMNILLWFSYTVMLSLYAHAFGSYGASFFSKAMQPLWRHLLMSGIIIVLTALNAAGARAVGRSEEAVVAVKVAILLLFIGVGLDTVETARLAPSAWSPPWALIAGGMIIFLAYEGFELIANTAGDVRDPDRTLPRGYYTAVGFVIVLYVLVSLVTVGNLPLGEIVGAKDYALAAAARPILGNMGFVLIAVAALLSTASAINATLYGASRVSYIIAKEGELPPELERKIWKRPIEGLLITSGLTLVLANAFDLSSISTIGSAGFLFIFAAVNAAALRLHRDINGNRLVPALGAIACLGALVVLLGYAGLSSPSSLFFFVSLVGLSFAIEALYRRFSGRRIKYLSTAPRKGSPT